MSEAAEMHDLAEPPQIQDIDLFIEDNELHGVAESLGLTAEDLRMMRSRFFGEVCTRDDVLSFESEIKAMSTAFDECPYPLFHTFADGMYTREIHFNKGDLIVGAIHKNEYFVNVLKGRIWVVSEFGAKEICAPASFTAKAGVKHIGFTLEDTVWTDTHRVESDNIADAEKEIFAESYDDLDNHNKVVYSKMCDDIGMFEQDIRSASLIESDLIDQPHLDPVEIKNSDIEGMGVFATRNIYAGGTIAVARIGDKRTSAGRYVNHSDNPNSAGTIDNGVGYFVAIRDIGKGDEITADYREIRKQAELLDRGDLCQDG